MCGIFALLNNGCFDRQYIKECFEKGKSRGPEYSEFLELNDNANIGFHRLAINGLNDKSNQPMSIDNITLICNGEIYNFKELFEIIGQTPYTNSDCEIIIHLYKKFGIEYTLSLLDGYFSFIIYDERDGFENAIYIARDAYGVRPLYILKPNEMLDNHQSSIFGFASELKMLSGFLNNEILSENKKKHYTIEQYPPGTYSILKLQYLNEISWAEYRFDVYAKKIATFAFNPHSGLRDKFSTPGEHYAVYSNIYYSLDAAVKKRVVGTTDRPIACLLSGGLDSSLIAALVTKHYHLQLETYSIGMPGGEDLKYAKMVADHIGSKHTEIILSEDEFFNAIPEVIRAIESYDTTTVRASVGNYLVSKYISKNSKAKVIFNGDGSDELTGGYLYFHAAPDALSFDQEAKRLLSDIHYFDVLRSDKSISSNGLEPRTPFLDREWVQTYLSVPLKYRYNPGKMEKWLLRKSFEIMDYHLLPSAVLWRTKEAFSDGVSSHSKSWYEIITERTSEMSEEYDQQLNFVHFGEPHLLPTTKEQIYYRKLFDTYYPNCYNVVPYFWMPRFVKANDASARTLKIYNDLVK